MPMIVRQEVVLMNAEGIPITKMVASYRQECPI